MGCFSSHALRVSTLGRVSDSVHNESGVGGCRELWMENRACGAGILVMLLCTGTGSDCGGMCFSGETLV